jgi:ankyrin repeat protein
MNITTNTVYIPHTFFLQYWEDSLFNVFLDEEDIFNTFSVENIERLLENGANVNEIEKEYGMNFLQKCILEGFSLHETEGEIFSEIIETLISAGIDLNHQDFDGCTAMHLAVEKNQLDLVKLLLEKGAIASIVDCEGKPAYL